MFVTLIALNNFYLFFYTTQTPAERRTRDLGGNSIVSPQKRIRNNSEVVTEASPRKSSRLASAAPVEASPRKSKRVTSTPQKTDPMMSSPRKHARMTNVGTPEGSPRKSSRLENASKTESPRRAAKSVISTPTSRPAKGESPRKTAKDQTTSQQSKQKTAKTENNTPRKTAGAKLKVPQVSQRHAWCFFFCICWIRNILTMHTVTWIYIYKKKKKNVLNSYLFWFFLEAWHKKSQDKEIRTACFAQKNTILQNLK